MQGYKAQAGAYADLLETGDGGGPCWIDELPNAHRYPDASRNGFPAMTGYEASHAWARRLADLLGPQTSEPLLNYLDDEISHRQLQNATWSTVCPWQAPELDSPSQRAKWERTAAKPGVIHLKFLGEPAPQGSKTDQVGRHARGQQQASALACIGSIRFGSSTKANRLRSRWR